MQEDYDFDWNMQKRSKSKMSLFSATSSPSSRAGLGTVFNLTIFYLIKNVFFILFSSFFSNNMIDLQKCQLSCLIYNYLVSRNHGFTGSQIIIRNFDKYHCIYSKTGTLKNLDK